MLDSSTAPKLIDGIWAVSRSPVVLPESWEGFFDVQGHLAESYENRRRFVRFYLRARAVIERKQIFYPVLTKDLSRSGLGLLTGLQLLPKEKVRLYLPTGNALDLMVARCRRIQSGCYECGMRFEIAPSDALSLCLEESTA